MVFREIEFAGVLVLRVDLESEGLFDAVMWFLGFPAVCLVVVLLFFSRCGAGC